MIDHNNSELQSEFLSDISARDKVWDTHKTYSDAIAQIYDGTSYYRYRDRILKCADYLSFAENEAGELKLHTAFFCRVPFCQVCQWRRSLKLRAKFFQVLPKLLSDCEGFRYVFLTLTVRNCDVQDLRSTLKWMAGSWDKLNQRRTFPAYKTGFIRSAEITRNYDVYYGGQYIDRMGTKQFHDLKYELRTNGFDTSELRVSPTREAHPHFHALLMVDEDYFTNPKKYWNYKKWISEWRSALKCDYDPSIRIKAVDPYSKLQSKPSDEVSLALYSQLGMEVDFDETDTAYTTAQPEYATVNSSESTAYTIKQPEYATVNSSESTAYTIKQPEYAINPKFIGVLLEVLKYSIKPSDLIGSICNQDAEDGFTNREWLLTATEQLYKTRRFAPGGVFKMYISEQDADAKDLIGKSENHSNYDENDLYFGWIRSIQKYKFLR